MILWPYYNVHFRFDVEQLLGKYVDGPENLGVASMQRDMALQLKNYMVINSRLIRRTRVALQVASVLLVLEVFAWLLSIASR